jgi:chromosome segregation protein
VTEGAAAAPGNARLTALRLVGFKSFADRTLVEFGAGISAVVGPNGSGKSNLADALRWTLGEQGRSLRTRRSEDVIFAGSSSRRGIGMADVTLVIDNHDRLLPVDYGEVEIGRRLYRSGENEYLLNRQRIRLRDLVELLDAGNLSDNAFLFIGQGMVDQALALRPEERRPLFEEAAGIRRHERRRRQAEAELAEAETNLERLRDLLSELRPQARRLAAQAEQLEARRSAGMELAEAVVMAARTRWTAGARSAAREQAELDRARAAADSASAELRMAEEAAAAISLAIGRRAEAERNRRDALDTQRALLTELRVAAARLDSEMAALGRDSERVIEAQRAADERIRAGRRALSQPRPEIDAVVGAELETLARRLAETSSAEPSAEHDRLTASRAGRIQQQRRHEALRDSLAAAQERVEKLSERLTDAAVGRTAAVEGARKAADAEAKARDVVEEARAALEAATLDSRRAADDLATTESEAAAAIARLAAAEAALASSTDEGFARAARARGGTRIAEGVEIEPRCRVAVAAALGHTATAYVIEEDAAVALAGRTGRLVLRVLRGRPRRTTTSVEDVRAAAVALGGGTLAETVRRDPQGVVTRLLERWLWVPALDAALNVRRELPPGWRVATLDGEIVSDEGVVNLGGNEAPLDLARQGDDLRRQLVELRAQVEQLKADRGGREDARAQAAAVVRAAQQQLDSLRGQRRPLEEAERVAERRHEQLLRELTWERSQVERLQVEVANAERIAEHAESELRELEARQTVEATGSQGTAAAQARRRALEGQLEALRRAQAKEQQQLDAWQDARRRAEIALALDEARVTELENEAERLVGRQSDLALAREGLASELLVADTGVAQSAAELQALVAAVADDRANLAVAERSALDARERLRLAEGASRRSEVAAMEARLQLDTQREQLLVELAGIGADGYRALLNETGLAAAEVSDDPSTEAMESALAQAVARWTSAPSRADDVRDAPAPSLGRVAVLRRRFHELGAGNPFAAEEYAELSARLNDLEAQRTDLETAISATRELIASLNTLISEQFRNTFAALEDAFARRFTELFGGGDAQLSLTEPDDLSATGVEIHARPPGKKRQPLSMLSGGERALTAVSLLLAMLEVRPVPFCVLDEVDAALDEANVVRFSAALRGLAERTQFIVITHNRGTIEAADALYGVTIGDDAVSRIVSLKLPPAETNGHTPPEAVAEAALA